MKLKDVVIEALIKVRLGTTAGESHSFVLTFNGEQVGGALRYLEQWWPELRDRLAAHITGVLVGSSHTFFEGAMSPTARTTGTQRLSMCAGGAARRGSTRRTPSRVGSAQWQRMELRRRTGVNCRQRRREHGQRSLIVKEE
jgi:hypothetical protein